MQQFKHKPKSFNKEIMFLKELGLSNEEIRYLVWKESKNRIDKKWRNKHYY